MSHFVLELYTASLLGQNRSTSGKIINGHVIHLYHVLTYFSFLQFMRHYISIINFKANVVSSSMFTKMEFIRSIF